MIRKQHGPRFERDQRKLQALQRLVLELLKKNGPNNWNSLYIYFDPHRTAAIAPALQNLRDCGYIEVTGEKTTITASGLARVEENAYR